MRRHVSNIDMYMYVTWTAKLVDVAVQSTISSRLNFMDFSEETTAHLNNVAHSMLAMSVGRARGAVEAV